MHYAQHIFFSDDLVPKDDIDKLFEKLEQIEPPPSLISRILKLTVKAPSPPQQTEPVLRDLWEELNSLVVRKEKQNPC